MKPAHILEVYRSPKSKKWFWRIRHRNRKIVADSAEGNGYNRRSAALKSLQSMLSSAVPLMSQVAIAREAR